MSRITANLLLLFVGAVWGMGFVAQSTAMDAIEPIFFTGIRFLVAALAVLPFAIWENRRIPAPGSGQDNDTSGQPWLSYVVLGTILFGALATQQIGLLTTSVTNSGFLTGLYVVLTPILAVTLFRLRPHWIVWPAAVLTLMGIFLLSGGRLDGLTTGDYWTILCAFFWAFHVLTVGQVLKRAGSQARPFTLAATQFFVCAIWGIALGFALESPTLASIYAASAEILFAGIISGGLAFSIQAVAQRYTTAPQAAIFMSSEALFAALFGAIILAERIPTAGIIGCALIFSAMMLVEIVPSLRKKAPPQIS